MRGVLACASVLCLLALPQASIGAAAAAAQQGTRLAALTLAQAWQVALENDPTYKAAVSEREAGQTNRAMGLAALLPQVSASLGRNKIRGTLDSPTATGDVQRTDLDYMSGTKEIRGTQTIFNWSRIAEYRQGQARADYSLAVFDTKSKDTTVRLINRYFQALLSYENVVLARNKLQANEKQIMAAQRRYDGGEGTVTDVRESQSRRDLSRADLIKAQDALIVARRELEEMLGSAPVALTSLATDFRAKPLVPATLSEWQARAMSNNAEIRAGQEGLRISSQEIDRTFGGHLPTLDLVVARRNVTNETLSTRGQDSITNSVGFQLALPIYSGGLTSAQVRQARHNRDRAFEELEATRERIAVEVTRQYQGVVSGSQRIDALVVAVESSAEALKAIEMGYQAGTRGIVDILDAQDQLYRSELDLTQARLQYVLARLMLAGAAGSLNSSNINAASSSYFGPDAVVLRDQRLQTLTQP